MYACIYVLCVCVCERERERERECVCVCMCVYTYIHTQTHIYIHIYFQGWLFVRGQMVKVLSQLLRKAHMVKSILFGDFIYS